MSHAIELDPTESAKKATRLYLLIGLILFCATGATVAVATVSWLDVGSHGFDHWDAILGLLIATTKATLVAAIYMHLLHEKKMVYFFIGLGLVHCAGMGFGLLLDHNDTVRDRYFYGETDENQKERQMYGFPTQSAPKSLEPPPVAADPIEDARPHIEGLPGTEIGIDNQPPTEATPDVGLGIHPQLNRETESAEGVRGSDE